MTTGSDRLELYGMMKEAWGEPLATALFKQIPPMDSSVIATKQDMENLARQLRGEMAELRGELRGEMTALRGELRGEFAELRSDFKASSRHTRVTIIAAAVSIWLTFYLPAVL